jgi:large subunit ribosomal protein L15
MKLNDIRDNHGARKKMMTVGRGIGCTKGKTCGRGVKGQKARSGVALKSFEGGQMPLIRRMPKRGFRNIFAVELTVMNIGRLQQAIDEGRLNANAPITEAMMVESGVIAKAVNGVRLLAKGSVNVKMNIVVTKASVAAIAAIEKAGGSVTVTQPAQQAA